MTESNEETTVNEVAEKIPKPGFGDDGEPLQPAFNIYDSRERVIAIFWGFIFTIFTLVIIGVTLHISGILYSTPDPLPNFTESYILKGYTHEFFAEPRSFNDSQAICGKRGGQLVIFNTSKESDEFDKFVVTTFRQFVRNATLNPHKRSGLQIWTGVRVYFKAAKLTQLIYKEDMSMISEDPVGMEMERYYKEVTQYKMCMYNTMDHVKLFNKAQQSTHGTHQYAVKDYTGKFVNKLGESMGCWGIRVLFDQDSLSLPFVCKMKSPEVAVKGPK